VGILGDSVWKTVLFYRTFKEIFPKRRIERQNRPNIKQALDPAILAD
jgi:hypothetical protein